MENRGFADLKKIRQDLSKILKAPNRMSVSEAAEKYRIIKNPNGYNGPWFNNTTPYLTEPMDCLDSREYKSVIFAGPAQCGKTEIMINWLCHIVINNPTDIMLVQTTHKTARDFVKRRIDRLFRHSVEVGAQLSKRRDEDNIFDKHFISGSMLSISWPSINELSGKPIPYMALTDYDRMPENVDGEGNAFGLSVARTKTFLSKAMTLAESSPGYELLDSEWEPTTPHEAPPTKGILALYNSGDRRRYYTQCFNCNKYFLFECSNLRWEKTYNIEDAAISAHLRCFYCGHKHEKNKKAALLNVAKWVGDGQKINDNGVITGDKIRCSIASFWLQGVAAKFQSWDILVRNYLNKKSEYEKTGDEQPLKTTINVDQGLPYIPQKLKNDNTPTGLKERAYNFGVRLVPPNARCLFAAVDVQKRGFVVQVHAIGHDLESWVIDRYELQLSNRRDENGDKQPIEPSKYLEDWAVLKSVLNNPYKIDNDSSTAMYILTVLCDSGGEDGVTENAYKTYRKFMKEGYRGRFLLAKGRDRLNKRIDISYPDSTKRKDRKSNARGDVPVLMINTNALKDAVVLDLNRPEPGPGFIHFPDWLPESFYKELTAEVKTNKGWRNISRKPNEAFDLCVYIKALTFYHKLDKIDLNSNSIPAYLKPLGHNPMIQTIKEVNIEKTKNSSPAKKQRRIISKGVEL